MIFSTIALFLISLQLLPWIHGKPTSKNLHEKEPNSSKGIVPNEGLYAVIRDDVIAAVGEAFSLQISDEANTYTSTPAQSGETSDVTYNFNTFLYDIDLEGFWITAAPSKAQKSKFSHKISLDDQTVSIGWDSFGFIIQFNYDICAKSWPNPCEDGYILVYSTVNVQLEADSTISLSGPTVQLTVNSAELIFQQGDIEVFVQCTDTLCLIPVDDIADAVAQQFQSTFQTALQTVMNQVASQYLNTIPTTYPLEALHLDLELTGEVISYPPPPSHQDHLIFCVDGAFTPNPNQQPPFTPTFAPPDSEFSSPGSQLNLLITEYMIESAIWASNLVGDFNMTITDKDLPKGSPVKLNTNDFLLLLIAPGLAQFPHMNVTIYISLHDYSSPIIRPTGIELKNDFDVNFFLSNSTFQHPGFEILMSLGVDAEVRTNMSNSQIALYTHLSNWTFSLSVESSAVGEIYLSYLTKAIQYVLPLIAPSPPVIAVPTVPGFAVSNPTITLNAGYINLGCDVQYTNPVPGVQCPGGTHTCPVQNTCCNWGGTWGCCTLPNAVCCDSGCCFSGTVCDNGSCDSDQRMSLRLDSFM